MSKYPMTLEETLQQAGEEFDSRETELQRTVAIRRDTALKDAKLTWQQENRERLEEQKNGLITSMDEFISTIRFGVRSFRYFNTSNVDVSSSKEKVKFGKNFLDRVILPMLENKTDFEIDGVLYGLEEVDIRAWVKFDTGRMEDQTFPDDSHGLAPVFDERVEMVAKDIRVGRVETRQSRVLV
jgi:hypothetical protein